jgi:hypothetical protein
MIAEDVRRSMVLLGLDGGQQTEDGGDDRVCVEYARLGLDNKHKMLDQFEQRSSKSIQHNCCCCLGESNKTTSSYRKFWPCEV